MAFVSFYLLGWSPLFWTYGRNILAPLEKTGAKVDSKAPFKERFNEFVSDPTVQRIFSPPVRLWRFLVLVCS